MRQTQEAVDRSGEEVVVQTVQRYRAAWAQPIFPPEASFRQALSRVVLEPAAVEALGLVSVHLHATAPEGVIPAGTRIDELRTQVRELIDAVRADEDLPNDLKHMIVLRLQEVESAFEHLDIGGPSAVRHATEAVIGTMAMMTRGTRFTKSTTIQKVCVTVAMAWTVFSIPPTMENSLPAWEHLMPQLAAAVEQPSDSPDAVDVDPSSSIEGNGGTEAPTAAR